MSEAINNAKHAKWGEYTAFVIETDAGKWYANILRAKGQDDIESWVKTGNTEGELLVVLNSFGAPGDLEWKPGNIPQVSISKLENQVVYYTGTSSQGVGTVYQITIDGDIAYGMIGDIGKGTRERPVQGFNLLRNAMGELRSESWATMEERPGS